MLEVPRQCFFVHCFQAHYSTGAVAGSFTSTAQVPVTKQEAGMASTKKGNQSLDITTADCCLE